VVDVRRAFISRKGWFPMKTPRHKLVGTVCRDLATWHAAHPEVRFAELENMVKEKIDPRSALLRPIDDL
jgi:hypothetical protein